MNYDFLAGKSFALVIWNTEKENDVRVCRGEVIEREDGFYFVNEEEKWRFTLTPELLERIKEVPEQLKKIMLQADYGLTVSLGSLPGNSTDGLVETGINWD